MDTDNNDMLTESEVQDFMEKLDIDSEISWSEMNQEEFVTYVVENDESELVNFIEDAVVDVEFTDGFDMTEYNAIFLKYDAYVDPIQLPQDQGVLSTIKGGETGSDGVGGPIDPPTDVGDAVPDASDYVEQAGETDWTNIGIIGGAVALILTIIVFFMYRTDNCFGPKKSFKCGRNVATEEVNTVQQVDQVQQGANPKQPVERRFSAGGTEIPAIVNRRRLQQDIVIDESISHLASNAQPEIAQINDTNVVHLGLAIIPVFLVIYFVYKRFSTKVNQEHHDGQATKFAVRASLV